MKNQPNFPARGERLNSRKESEAKTQAEVFSMDEIKKERKIKEFLEQTDSLKKYSEEHYKETISAEQLESFNSHNDEVARIALEMGIEEDLPDDKLLDLSVACRLHDISKGENPPEEGKGIPGFMVVYHHIAACNKIEKDSSLRMEIEKVLRKNDPKLEEDDLNKRIENIKSAIMSHMGPSPGFMEDMLNKVNKGLEDKHKIKHPSPEKGDVIAELLLTADMRSLASPDGVKKILKLRSDPASPFFQEEDLELCDEYKELNNEIFEEEKESENISISIAEAAFISALKSGMSARDMFKEGTRDYKWVESAINEVIDTEEFEYIYKEKQKESLKEIKMKIKPKEVLRKMKKYEKLKAEKEARERISEAA